MGGRMTSDTMSRAVSFGRFLAVATAALLFCAASTAHADCTENVLDGFNIELGYGESDFGSIGQTFTACQSGVVTSITIHEGDDSTGSDYVLWLAEEMGGPNTDYTGGPPWESFAGPGGGFPQTVTFELTAPFPVTEGTLYRFIFNSPGIIEIRCTTSPPDYPGGLATDNFGTYQAFDLDFEVGIANPPDVPATSTPGLIGLTALLVALASLAVWRKRNREV